MQKIFKTQYEKMFIKYIKNSANNINRADIPNLNYTVLN